MRNRLRKTLPAAAAALAAAALAAAPATAQAASGRWQIAQFSFPTTLVPGTSAGAGGTGALVPEYSAVFTNVGPGTASGPIRISESLPPGVRVSPYANAKVTTESAGEECATPTPNLVLCEIEQTIVSGEGLTLSVPLEVAATAPSPASTTVTIAGGGPATASSVLTGAIGNSPAPFGLVAGPRGALATASGPDAGLAGGHPYAVVLEDNFNSIDNLGSPYPSADLKDLELRLPKGFTVDPQAMGERCTEAELATATQGLAHGEGGCGRGSQVGQITVETVVTGAGPYRLPLYDMEAPPGVAAELGFNVLGSLIHIQGGLDGSFHLTGGSSDILAKYSVLGIRVELWGNPADTHHDRVRQANGGCGSLTGCSLLPSEANKAPFVTMPTSCSGPLTLGASALSWVGSTAGRETDFTMLGDGTTMQMGGCASLGFAPSIESKATTDLAEAPSGLDFSIHQPQDEAIEGRSTARLEDVKVALPEGMSLNPSAANGMEACTLTQMGYAPEGPKVQFTTEPQHCPPASKVGTVMVNTPLLGHELPGAVYVAKPWSNPFGSLLAVYLAIEDEASGIIAKLAGKVTADPRTGRLTAIFAENPDLPLEDIRVHFFGGEHGVLSTPLTCGEQTTTATLTPWSAPQAPAVAASGSFGVSGGCSGSEAAAPKSADLTAGTEAPLAGAYSPFVLRISRPDASQHITGIQTTLPEGLLGRLAGIPYCPASGISQAQGREKPEMGRLEEKDPSCPQASEVGTVNVTAGSGSDPLPVSGHAYLSGPYKGAPLSLVVIVPAVAGPFDLGTVVDRVALNVGEYDARIHAVADPLPTIRQGIPLDVRSIELKLDRSNFTLNPTSCEAKQIEASVSTQAGQSRPLSNRFQVGECGRLAFRPRLKLSLSGATGRTGHPALKAVVTYPKEGDYANIARAQVSLPHSEFLDQGNIGKACTKPVLAERACPKKSIYGRARAWSPLLEKPLEGPVYLVGGYGYKLPAMVAELNGQVRLLLVGKVDTDKQHGIRNTFEVVPDAPVSRFVLQLKGGKHYGLLENSEDICSKRQKAGVAFRAQNGRKRTLSVPISNGCGKSAKHRRSNAGHGRRAG